MPVVSITDILPPELLDARETWPVEKKKSLASSDVTLYLTIGFPGSGKTTYIRKQMPKILRVCLDDLAKMTSDRYRMELSALYREAENTLIVTFLEKGHNVVVDRTCLSPKTRHRFISLARSINVKTVGIYFDIPIEEAKKRNLNKDRVSDGHYVGEDVYRKLQEDFEPPSLMEGFAHIIRVAD